MPLGNLSAIDDAKVTAEDKYQLAGKLNSTTNARQFGHDEHRVVTFGTPIYPAPTRRRWTTCPALARHGSRGRPRST